MESQSDRLKVLITGASRGIGLAVAELYQKQGHTVVTPTRSDCDLSNRDSVAKYIKGLSTDFDVLINNAGINPIRKIQDIELDTWDQVMQTNLTSPLLLIQHLAPAMAKRGFGRIVNISSAYSAKAREGRAMYSASKAALDSLTRTTALEFAGQGILANSVCPGFVDTELTRKNNPPEVISQLVSRIPLARLATPLEIAETVLFLGSKKNSYISGQCINVDGAFSIK